MPRPTWKGYVSFGLVNIPVTLYPAEKSSELHFKLIDSKNNAHVKYKRVNEITGEEVPWNQIVKGYELHPGNMVILDDEDFKKAAVERTRAIEITDFVELADISLLYFDKPYYLAPGERGEKGYVLLRKTLERTQRVGIAKVVITSREYLAAVVPVEGVLVLELMRFEQEIRKKSELDLPDEQAAKYKVSDKELAMAEKLVETMASDWEPARYRDDYQDKLLGWIRKKAEAGETAEAPSPEDFEKDLDKGVINIMDLLKKSVQATEKATDKKGQARSAAKHKKSPARKRA